MNHRKICTACGTQFPESLSHIELCPICTDDRQAVPESGQNWTTLGGLCDHHAVIIKNYTNSYMN